VKLTDPRSYTVHHLLSVQEAAARAGLSTKLFLVAAQAGQLGPVELMYLGRQKFVRASALSDFLLGTAKGAEGDDLFSAA